MICISNLVYHIQHLQSLSYHLFLELIFLVFNKKERNTKALCPEDFPALENLSLTVAPKWENSLQQYYVNIFSRITE